MKPESWKKTLFSFLLFFILAFLLNFFDNLGSLSFAKGPVEKLTIVAKTAFYQFKLSDAKNAKTTEDNKKIESKEDVLKAQISVLKSENVAMKRLLGTPLPPEWRFLPAQVIGSRSLEKIEIDKGRLEGVKMGMAVIFDNILVGRITRINEHFAEVMLPTASESRILAVTRPSETEGNTGTILAKGILMGQGGRMNLERVTLKEKLETDGLVVSAGDEFLPPNLLLGKMRKISKKEGDIYQKAEVEPSLNYTDLETVFVVIYY
ncbi:MAG: rod shape-determining protein MreC [bacterium]|nr:rod shape-determining protein MreC [bacterium]